ncbi:hypothetical protein PVK06_017648 [Gossypium arboreum]|uniref:Reverse transcriptase n=1 Tax=Gossypium arboreum TaxID=29729 RepID=A0ABR0Q3A2_GOSAR|nr:hypothetical protein PVK06_017648 [Gossypium arboreum]
MPHEQVLDKFDFANVSGQEINFEKSMILFNPNTPKVQRQLFGDLLGIKVVDKLDNYLELPFSVGKKKTLAFQESINRFSCRINSWSKRLLSFGGKEIFIKAVLQSFLTYAFSVFLAFKVVIEDMQAKICRTWWTSSFTTKSVYSSLMLKQMGFNPHQFFWKDIWTRVLFVTPIGLDLYQVMLKRMILYGWTSFGLEMEDHHREHIRPSLWM